MKIFLTGAAGFIGSHLTERLLADGHEVLGLDNFNQFYDPAIKERNIASALTHPNFRLVRGDICDAALLENLFAEFKPERLVHLAAWAGVRPSIENPAIYQTVNLEGTVNLFERCRHDGVRHIVFASSSSVYGDRETVPFSEQDFVGQPISPYAATKRAGELLAYTWHHLFDLNIDCLRFFTVYGPRQRPEMAIAKFTQAIHDGQTVTLFGDGSSARDYTYIDDIIDGVMRSIERVEGYRIFNLGNSTPTRLSRLVEVIGESVGRQPMIAHLPNQPGDVSRTFADVSFAGDALGYAPTVSIEEGVRRYVAWFKANRA
ncbi:MAG: NAD-dependent epimerase/dehydratase family protein [Myxococcota bacterium]|nr:NAD-dependent epimerase/dehydratase family protein [Myxococcota bacterium]